MTILQTESLGALGYQTPERMARKLAAVPFPADLTGKTVLDVGCDEGAWCKLASDRNAKHVVGIDRNRPVRGQYVDLIARNRGQGWPRCEFEHYEVGKDWRMLGRFDLVLCQSMYHHAWANCRAHDFLWRWLREHVAENGMLLWEGPTDSKDPVAAAVTLHDGAYEREAILGAARMFFTVEVVGRAGHVATREVWRCTPKPEWDGWVVKGAGGATPAFLFAGGRRVMEIRRIIGTAPYPGSLNLHLTRDFAWDDTPYLSGLVSDVTRRGMALDRAVWEPRPARLYPVYLLNGPEEAWVFRFEHDMERYALNFVELIAPVRLRDSLDGCERVTICPR